MINKIKELFEYRKIPFLLSQLSQSATDNLLPQLYLLQERIYDLDLYLETNWVLKQKVLTRYWSKIYESLGRIGLTHKEAYAVTADIRKYQKHEMQLRDGLLPIDMNMEYYYHYKSCDVRLMRELISRNTPKDSRGIPVTAWRYFDLITEVNDDVEDVFEDQTTINGNYFLIHMIKNDVEQTRTSFLDFLDLILDKSLRLVSTEIYQDIPQLKTWTLENKKETDILIHTNLGTIKHAKTELTSPIFRN